MPYNVPFLCSAGSHPKAERSAFAASGAPAMDIVITVCDAAAGKPVTEPIDRNV